MEKKLNAATFVYAFNWLVVCLCCGGTYMLVRPFDEIFNDLFEGKALPPLSDMLMHNLWILALIPQLWCIVTIAFAITQHATKKVVFHVLASVFLGGLTFVVYATAAFLPMIKIIGSFGK